MSDLVLYRCCEHCWTDCRNPDQHAFRCHEDDDENGPCEQGSEHAEVVTP